MATLKAKEIGKMDNKQREEKLKELKMELIKSQTTGAKTGKSKTKEIKKVIARILTLNNSKHEKLKNK